MLTKKVYSQSRVFQDCHDQASGQRKRTLDDTLLLMRTRAARKLFTEGPKIFELEISDSDDEQDDYEKLQILQNVHKDLISGQNS